MRIWKQVTLAVIFAIAGIAFSACDNGTGIGSGTDAGRDSNASSGTDIGEKIIGTWLGGPSYTWVFDADGNLTVRYFDSGQAMTSTFKFIVTGTKLVIAKVSGSESVQGVYDIYLSPNGKTLILVYDGRYAEFMFTKQ